MYAFDMQGYESGLVPCWEWVKNVVSSCRDMSCVFTPTTFEPSKRCLN